MNSAQQIETPRMGVREHPFLKYIRDCPQTPILYMADETIEFVAPFDGLIYVARQADFDGVFHLAENQSYEALEPGPIIIHDGDVVYWSPGAVC